MKREETKREKIIIFEDERIVGEDIKLILERLGYKVPRIETSGEKAIKIIKKFKPDLLLIDIVLNGKLDGIEVAEQIRRHYNIPIIYLTAYADEKILARAKATEPHGYIIKPFDERDLRTAVEIALYKHKTEQKLRESFEKLKKSLESTVKALAIALEKRDPYTAGHSWRVAQLAFAIAKELKIPEEKITGVHMAAAIHDIGKIYVPSEILSKPTRLTEGEFMIVKSHCQVGYDILKTIEFPWPIAKIVYQHHERLNGTGYPQGLKDKEILLEAKILGVADVVEAMCSHRPYRPAPGLDKALNEIAANKGILYEADVVDACLRLFKKKHFKFNSQYLLDEPDRMNNG